MNKYFFLLVIFFIFFSNLSFAQSDRDTLRIPLLKKTTQRGWLINVVKPVYDRILDLSITGYPEEIVERRYMKIPTNIYQSNSNKTQKKDIIILVGMNKLRTKKYIMADIDMDGRFSDEDIHTFDKANISNLDYWKKNAPIFSFPYSVMDNGQPVQKYSMHRIIPWNLIELQDISKLLFDIVLYPIDHYESDESYNDETILVSDMGDKGDSNCTFAVLVNDEVSSQSAELWKYSGDIIKYQLKNYKIISIKKGRVDYLVLATATTDDLNESLKPYFRGNIPQDITFTISSNDVNDNFSNNLYSYRGKFLLLNFWGTWCGPCRKITPDLIELYKLIDKNKIKMLGVNCEFGNGQSNPQNYIDEEKIEWPQIFEVIEKENKGFLNTAKITNFPSLILIDDKGVVQARVSKPEEIQQLINDINGMFKQ